MSNSSIWYNQNTKQVEINLVGKNDEIITLYIGHYYINNFNILIYSGETFCDQAELREILYKTRLNCSDRMVVNKQTDQNYIIYGEIIPHIKIRFFLYVSGKEFGHIEIPLEMLFKKLGILSVWKKMLKEDDS